MVEKVGDAEWSEALREWADARSEYLEERERLREDGGYGRRVASRIANGSRHNLAATRLKRLHDLDPARSLPWIES